MPPLGGAEPSSPNSNGESPEKVKIPQRFVGWVVRRLPWPSLATFSTNVSAGAVTHGEPPKRWLGGGKRHHIRDYAETTATEISLDQRTRHEAHSRCGTPSTLILHSLREGGLASADCRMPRGGLVGLVLFGEVGGHVSNSAGVQPPADQGGG